VLILDEPTNDMDTDMLAAIEDLLDSWPGTLLVVSHDRYFLERVTDQQYAVMGGHLRHLPGGVDEYLRLRAAGEPTLRQAQGSGAAPAASALSGAELRAAQKEIAALERKIQKLTEQIDKAKHALVDHDQSDYEGLAAKMKDIAALEAEVEENELRWLELSEQIG
jgi:DNA repair exonuclease SbcCD ATPase subunit